ncbi:glycosyltransferase [Sodalis sp. C49]|uniref:glycosyltransferase n=1 Tax=Sodalis sp. C49 TaxID=3228929 RepID=UPI003965CFDC
MKILYFPPDGENVNGYTARFRNILSHYGNVNELYYKNIMMDVIKLNLFKYDVIFFNWLDSRLVNKEGRYSKFSIFKVLVRFALAKLVSKKTVFVRHNLFPHHTYGPDIDKVKNSVNFLEALCTYSIVHSPTCSTSKRYYVPHPLYQYPLLSIPYLEQKFEPNLFVFFGRIVKYKNLHDLITAFPTDKKLIIAGNYDDNDYVDYLKKLAGDNITISAGYISDDKARELLNRSQGVIISHSDVDMIVSGSFFYALTNHARVICVKSDFLSWAERQLGSECVICFNDLQNMTASLGEIPPRAEFTQQKLSQINYLFGDATIIESLDHVFSQE